MRPQTNEPQDPPEPPPPPPSGVTKTGTNGNDLLVGTGYADQLYGLAEQRHGDTGMQILSHDDPRFFM